MPIRIQCPNCGKSALVPDSIVGKQAKCKCGSSFSIVSDVQLDKLDLGHEASKSCPSQPGFTSVPPSHSGPTPATLPFARQYIVAQLKKHIKIIGICLAVIGLLITFTIWSSGTGLVVTTDDRSKVDAYETFIENLHETDVFLLPVGSHSTNIKRYFDETGKILSQTDNSSSNESLLRKTMLDFSVKMEGGLDKNARKLRLSSTQSCIFSDVPPGDYLLYVPPLILKKHTVTLIRHIKPKSYMGWFGGSYR